MQTTVRGVGQLSQLAGKKYLGLETYRKNGEPVLTPVWFGMANGLLYIVTDGKSGKAKRIRRNPHVRVVAVTTRGKPDGEWIEGTASITEGTDLSRTRKLILARYGRLDKVMASLYRLFTRRRESEAVITIHV